MAEKEISYLLIKCKNRAVALHTDSEFWVNPNYLPGSLLLCAAFDGEPTIGIREGVFVRWDWARKEILEQTELGCQGRICSRLGSA